jgi:hypothetical protein
MRHKIKKIISKNRERKKIGFPVWNGDFSGFLKAGKKGSGSERDQCGFKTAMVWWYDLLEVDKRPKEP